jgi:cold shock CspA family protein
MQKGTTKRLIADRGFGFIKTEREEELFFGRNQLQGVDYGSLREGQKWNLRLHATPTVASTQSG